MIRDGSQVEVGLQFRAKLHQSWIVTADCVPRLERPLPSHGYRVNEYDGPLAETERSADTISRTRPAVTRTLLLPPLNAGTRQHYGNSVGQNGASVSK